MLRGEPGTAASYFSYLGQIARVIDEGPRIFKKKKTVEPTDGDAAPAHASSCGGRKRTPKACEITSSTHLCPCGRHICLMISHSAPAAPPAWSTYPVYAGTHILATRPLPQSPLCYNLRIYRPTHLEACSPRFAFRSNENDIPALHFVTLHYFFFLSQMMKLETIKYSAGKLEVLDQLQLPHVLHYDEIKTCEDAYSCIRSMRVRGKCFSPRFF